MRRRNRNRTGGAPRPPLLALLGLGVLLALAFALPARAATPAEIVLLGTDPQYSQVTVNLPGGGQVGPTGPGQFQLQVTPAGGTPTVHQAFCIDSLNPIGPGTAYQVVLQTAADAPELANPAHAEAGWLMQEADRLIAASPNPSLEAGAIQTAVWVILGQADPTTPTSDATLNARRGDVDHADRDGHARRERDPCRHRRHAERQPGDIRPNRHRDGDAVPGGGRDGDRDGHLQRRRAHAGLPLADIDGPRAAGDRLRGPPHLHGLGQPAPARRRPAA